MNAPTAERVELVRKALEVTSRPLDVAGMTAAEVELWCRSATFLMAVEREDRSALDVARGAPIEMLTRVVQALRRATRDLGPDPPAIVDNEFDRPPRAVITKPDITAPLDPWADPVQILVDIFERVTTRDPEALTGEEAMLYLASCEVLSYR